MAGEEARIHLVDIDRLGVFIVRTPWRIQIGIFEIQI